MNQPLVDQIANAVLYEGYMLYPYRPSVKNRQRWTFGGLYPQAYSEAQGGTDAWTMQTECLVRGGSATTLDLTVRFLHLMARQVGELAQPLTDLLDGDVPAFRPVDCVQVEGKRYQTWQEAVERRIPLGETVLETLIDRPRVRQFRFPEQRQWEPLRSASGEIVAVMQREQQAVTGAVELSAVRAGDGLFTVTAKIVNVTPLEDAAGKSRDDAQLRALVSTHTILGVRAGEFVSLLDPPEPCRAGRRVPQRRDLAGPGRGGRDER